MKTQRCIQDDHLYALIDLPVDTSGVRVLWNIDSQTYNLSNNPESIFSAEIVEVGPNLSLFEVDQKDLKAERTAQWGSDSDKLPKGWNCWRATTFMEMIRAKWDRALQAQNQIRILDSRIIETASFLELNELLDTRKKLDDLRAKRKALVFDGEDSIKDALNYARKFKEICDADSGFYTEPGLR